MSKNTKFRLIYLVSNGCNCFVPNKFRGIGGCVMSSSSSSTRYDQARYTVNALGDMVRVCNRCSSEIDRNEWPDGFIVPILQGDRVVGTNSGCCGLEEQQTYTVRFVSGSKGQYYIVMNNNTHKPACHKCVELLKPDLFDQVEW